MAGLKMISWRQLVSWWARAARWLKAVAMETAVHFPDKALAKMSWEVDSVMVISSGERYWRM